MVGSGDAQFSGATKFVIVDEFAEVSGIHDVARLLIKFNCPVVLEFFGELNAPELLLTESLVKLQSSS